MLRTTFNPWSAYIKIMRRAMASISKQRRNEASIRRFFTISNRNNRLILFYLVSNRIKKMYYKTFWSKESMNLLIPKSSRSKGIEKVYPDTFWSEEKTNLLIPKSLRLKRIEKGYPKNFLKQRKQNQCTVFNIAESAAPLEVSDFTVYGWCWD